MSFMLLKHIHVSSALISFVLFFLRGIWSFNDSPVMRQRWIKIVPHIVDTLLLASAITMAIMIQQYPFVNSWLTAKVIGLLLYIGLGFVALKYGKSKITRVTAWLAAQLVFFYIVLVAIKHNPLPFIS